MSQRLFDERATFQTERLIVQGVSYTTSRPSGLTNLADRAVSILTPAVTSSLPPGWQQIDTVAKAVDWIKTQIEESDVFTIELGSTRQLSTQAVVGFLFLNGEPSTTPNQIDVRLGYLLAEEVWGRGLGSELIKGLVDWCEELGNVASITGGVELGNHASIRVLEKNGFIPQPNEDGPAGMIFLEKRIAR